MEIKTIKTSTEVCPRGKKISINLLDAVLCFFSSLLLFIGAFEIYSSTSYYKNCDAQINSYVQSISSLVSDSRLSYVYVDKNNSTLMKNPDEISYEFTLNLIYQKAILIDNDKYVNMDKFSNLEDDKDYDILSFYYGDYYHNNSDKYSNYNSEKNLSYFQNKFLNSINNKEYNYLVLEDNKFSLTNKYVEDYLKHLDGNKQASISFFSSINEAYNEILNDTIEDYMINFVPYASLEKQYSQIIDKQNQELLSLLLFTFFLAVMILYFVIPLIFKDGRTIFMKVFKTSLISTSLTPVKWYQILIKAITLLFLYLFMPCFSSIMVLGYVEGISVLMTDFLNIFNLFALALLMVLFMICSIFFTFYKKDSKQTFSELFSFTKTYENNTIELLKIGDKTFEIKK